MTDLNSLVAPGYPDDLYAANDINDFGEITGQAIAPGGAALAFVASARGGPAPSTIALRAARSLPGAVRTALLTKAGIRPRELYR
jgi:hypothetical protein